MVATYSLAFFSNVFFSLERTRNGSHPPESQTTFSTDSLHSSSAQPIFYEHAGHIRLGFSNVAYPTDGSNLSVGCSIIGMKGILTLFRQMQGTGESGTLLLHFFLSFLCFLNLGIYIRNNGHLDKICLFVFSPV